MAGSETSSDLKTLTAEKQKDYALPAAVLALDLSPDGQTLLAAAQDGGVYRVNTSADGGAPVLIGRHESYASGLALLPDGNTVLSSGYDGALQWHDLAAARTSRRQQVHQFWSWDLDVSADGKLAASVTGRYEAGGYKYEPAAEHEPSVKLIDVATGAVRHELQHVPPVQAVALSPDGQFVAAGNLMGEIRVWETASGRQISAWTTPDLTSWGIVKSHHYLGGVFAMTFAPQGEELYVCGMGPMRDPMAGNGVQRWQRFAWRDGRKLDETHEGESGQGLMEAIAFHPSGRWFVMAGRLFLGQWNVALFETATGRKLHAFDAKHRVTDVRFTADGTRFFLAKAKQQEKRKDGKWPGYGAIECYAVRT